MTAATAQRRCVETPVSWLRLERYHLGELDGAERARVETHLERCPVCRDCLAAIVREAEAPAPSFDAILAALEAAPAGATATTTATATTASAAPERPPRQRWWQRFALWAGVGALAAAAAAALIVIRIDTRTGGGGLVSPGGLPPSRIRFKGGSLAISLVRARGGAVELAPTTFAPSGGDRFKVELTCGSGGEVRVETVVLQGRDVAFPLGRARRLRCGNRVPLPGAFGVDGNKPIDVCLVVSSAGESRISRRALRDRGLKALPRDRSVCVRVVPNSLR
ncbi:MAG: zf-HC2 domain-containing protein [Myxococcales bacterium]|nr:zf-HC2 domain-containing protein [Myxococcales bacterium]